MMDSIKEEAIDNDNSHMNQIVTYWSQWALIMNCH